MGMQRYLGGNGDALAAMRDGSRNVGAMYAFDSWQIARPVRVSYGAKYARYDYLTDRGCGVRVPALRCDRRSGTA